MVTRKFTPAMAPMIKQRMSETKSSDYKIGDSFFQEDHFGGKTGIKKRGNLELTLTICSDDPRVKIRKTSPWSTSIRFPGPIIIKEPMMEGSIITIPQGRPPKIDFDDLYFRIGDSVFKRGVFEKVGGKVIPGKPIICDLGVSKICRKCKRKFTTGKRHSLVICPECKTKLKNRPAMYEKICPICHEPYRAKRSDAKTCGKDRCRKALYRKNNP